MTSTTGTDEHPEVAEISALAEGVLPPGRSAHVREHVDGCSLCSDVSDSLDEIRGLLGSLPGPPPMPADIVGRIDAALAAEALLDSTGPLPAVSRETVPTSPDRPGGHARAASGPGAPAGPGRPRKRRRWVRAALITACAGAAVTLGSLVIGDLGVDGRPEGAGEATSVKSDSRHDLSESVRALLADAGASPDVGVQGTEQSPMQGDIRPVVPECVSDGIRRAEPPLAAELGTHLDTASYLVVLPHPGDPALVDAYVVDARCTTAPGDVLFTGTYKR